MFSEKVILAQAAAGISDDLSRHNPLDTEYTMKLSSIVQHTTAGQHTMLREISLIALIALVLLYGLINFVGPATAPFKSAIKDQAQLTSQAIVETKRLPTPHLPTTSSLSKEELAPSLNQVRL